MKKILSLAGLNFRTALKEKIFIGLIFFFLFLLGVSVLLAKLGVGESEKVLRNAGLVGIELTGILLVIFSVVFNFYREKDNHMLEIYLSFSSRFAYIGGKLLGYIGLIFSYCIIGAIGYAVILYFKQAFTMKVLIGIYPIFLKLCITLFFTLLLCIVFSTNFIALFSSFFLYIVSETSKFALELVSKGSSTIQLLLYKGIYHLLPNFDKLDIKSQVIYKNIPSINFFLIITLYTIGYLLFLYLLTTLIFKKKQW